MSGKNKNSNVLGFSLQSLGRRQYSSSASPSLLVLQAKRNKNNRRDDSSDNLNQWYDAVDDNATPDEVFWQEMDRQRLFNDISSSGERDPYAVAASSAAATTTSMPMSSMSSGPGGASSSSSQMGGSGTMNDGMGGGGMNTASMTPTRKAPTMDQQKAAESTLSEYTLYQVADNWLDERLIEQMEAMRVVREEEEEMTIEEETRLLEEQLEALPDGYGDKREVFMESNEPWDHFGEDTDDVEPSRQGMRQVPEPTPGTFFFFC